jgi:peptide/nickel transport system permease protein
VAQLTLSVPAVGGDLRTARQGSRFWRRYRRHKLALAGTCFIAVIALMGIFAPIVAPIDPAATKLSESLQPPSSAHWLGTDLVGRDTWSRTIYAIRVSLAAGVLSMAIAATIALVLGSLAGFYGGLIDMVLMRATDVIMCVPSLVIVIALVAVIGPGLLNIILAIGILGWTGMTRLLRAQILAIRAREFVIAARCLGAPNGRIMLRHILPNCIAPVLVAATLGVAGAILTEASLSFLGFGVLPPASSWGDMLNSTRSLTRLQENRWLWIPPGTMILLTVLSINFIGDGLRDALDPRERER